MSLDKGQFDNIIDLLVKDYMDCAKERIRQDNLTVPFNEEPNSEQLLCKYFDALKLVYAGINLPDIYWKVCTHRNIIEQSIDRWSSSRKVLVELRPLNLNAVVRQLNHDFSTNHALSDKYEIGQNQAMMLTFMLSDQPGLLQQLVALPRENINKFLIAMLILCAVLSAVCSFYFLVPTAVAAVGLFAQLKKPGHRELFTQHAVEYPARARDMGELLLESRHAENMLAKF